MRLLSAWRVLLSAGVLALVLLLLLASTPVGVWVAARFLEAAAEERGWQLRIRDAGGVPLRALHLGAVTARHAGAGLQLEAESAWLDPWSWRLRLRRPRLHLSLPDAAELTMSAPDTVRLPLAGLPAIDIEDGAFELLRADGTSLELGGVTAAYTPADSAAGLLDLEASSWSVAVGETRIEGAARTRWQLQATRIASSALWLRWQAGDSAAGTARGHLRLDLAPGQRLETALTVEGDWGSITDAWGDLSMTGDLAPRQLAVHVEAGGRHTRFGDWAAQTTAHVGIDTVRLDSAIVDVANGAVHVEGVYNPGTRRIAARALATGLDLARMVPGPLAGAVDGQLSVDGLAATPRASLTLTTPRLEGLAPVSLAMTVDGKLAADGQLRLVARSQRLGSLQADGPFALGDGDYDLTLRGQLDAGLWLPRATPTALRGRLRPDTLEVGLTAERLPFGEDPPGPVHAEVSVYGNRDLTASLRVGTGQLQAQLRMDLTSAASDSTTVRVQDFDLRHLVDAVGGRVTGTGGAAAGGWSRGRGSTLLVIDDLSLSGWSVGPVHVAGGFAGGATHVDATGRGLAIHAAADSVGAARLEITMDGAVMRAQAAAPGSEADSAVVHGRLEASGPLSDPSAARSSLHLERLDASLGGSHLRLLQPTRLDYTDGRGQLHDARVHTPLGQLRLRGRTVGDSLDVTVVLDSLVSGGALSSRGQARLDVGGTLAAPRARLRAALHELSLAGRSLGTVTVDAELSDSLRGSLYLRSPGALAPTLTVDLRAPAATLRPRDTPSGHDRVRLQIRADGVDGTALASYAFDDSTAMRFSLASRLSLPARKLRGGLRWQDLRGEVELTDLMVDRERVRLRLAQPAAVRLAADTVRVSGIELPVEIYRRDSEAFESAGSFEVGGWLAAGGTSWRLDARDVDLEAVELALPGRVSLPTGTATGGVLYASGVDSQAVDSQAVDSQAVDINLEADLYDLGYLTAIAVGQPGRWQGRATWMTLVEDSLVVTASAPAEGLRPRWAATRLHAQSSAIDLLWLLDLVPQLDHLGGTARLDLRMDSLGTRPCVDGYAEVEDLQLRLLDVEPGYRFPRGRLVFAEGGARGELRDFVGETTRGRGQLALRGFVEVLAADDLEYELHLTSANVPYGYDDVFATPDIRMDVTLRSQPQGSLLAGTVTLNEPEAEVQIVDLKAPPVPPPPAVQNDFLESMRLDLYVDIDGLRTRSALFDLEAAGQVRVYGTFYKPRFQGEVEVSEGTAIILNRQFDFTRGRVVVDRLLPTHSILDLIHDPIRLDPELDVEAVTRVTARDEDVEREVTFRLRGPVSSAVPQLTSPGLGDLETMSLLAFGSTSEAYYDYASAFYTAAGQLLLSRQVHKVGLDEFLLLPSGTVLGTVGENSIRIGKHLTWPLPAWVRYEAIASEPSLGQLEIEYRVTSWLTIDAAAHSQYELYGLGIGLRRDF